MKSAHFTGATLMDPLLLPIGSRAHSGSFTRHTETMLRAGAPSTTLPLHGRPPGSSSTSGGLGNRIPGATDQFANAMTKGLSLVGMSRTKGGSDDKEVAYVLRQNSLLKCFSCVVILVALSSAIVFSTVYELSIVRRDLLHSEIKHHKIEKTDHEEFIRASLMLQHALQLEVQELKEVEEFRSRFQKTFGTFANKLIEMLAKNQVKPDVMQEINAMNQSLSKDIQDILGKLIHKFVMQSKAAKQRLDQVSGDIVRNVEEKARLDERFRKKVQALGEDPYSEEMNDLDSYNNDEDDDDYVEEENHPDKKKGLNRRDRVKRDEQDIARELDQFFSHFEVLSFPVVPASEIQSWSDQLSKLEEVLEDDTKEADVDVIVERFQKSLPKGVPKFNPDDHDSVVDYISATIEQAKLMAHKQELTDLYRGYKEGQRKGLHGGRIDAYTVVASMEKLAQENDLYLLFEWLENMDPVKPGDFHYGESDKKKPARKLPFAPEQTGSEPVPEKKPQEDKEDAGASEEEKGETS